MEGANTFPLAVVWRLTVCSRMSFGKDMLYLSFGTGDTTVREKTPKIDRLINATNLEQSLSTNTSIR